MHATANFLPVFTIYIFSSQTFFPSESFHQREVQQNDARRERNFRIRRHLSVDDTEQSSQNTETNQVMWFVRFLECNQAVVKLLIQKLVHPCNHVSFVVCSRTYHRKSYCLLAGPCSGLQMVEFSTLITTLEKPHG